MLLMSEEINSSDKQRPYLEKGEFSILLDIKVYCCFALILRIVCRVVRNSLAIALILVPDLMRSGIFSFCSSFNTGVRPKRFPASRVLSAPNKFVQVKVSFKFSDC